MSSQTIHPAIARYAAIVSLCLCMAMITGCATRPEYKRPEMDLPETWHQAPPGRDDPDAVPLADWWKLFHDPMLADLLERAVAENLDLQTAVMRIEESLALRGVARGERVPGVTAAGLAQSARLSDMEGGAQRDSRTIETYSTGLDASWELDVWGRIRQSVRAADADLDASIEDYRDALVMLVAEIAGQYLTVRELQERIVLLKGNIAAQKDTLQLTRGRYEVGLAPALDVHQAELNLTTSQSSLPPLRAQQAAGLHRLAVLTGQPPGDPTWESGEVREGPHPDFGLLAGIPANLLHRRPDVRRAEQLLMAQTARLGVARTDLLPRISLSGTFALQADSPGDIGLGGSQSYQFGPSLHWPLFQGGRIRSNIAAGEARVEQAILQYRQSVLLALEDVENAFVEYQLERDRHVLIERSAESAERSVEQVHMLYESGLVPFLNVLDAERNLVQQQDLLAQSRGRINRGIVRIYRALGGGWAHADTEPEKAESAEKQ